MDVQVSGLHSPTSTGRQSDPMAEEGEGTKLHDGEEEGEGLTAVKCLLSPIHPPKVIEGELTILDSHYSQPRPIKLMNFHIPVRKPSFHIPV